MSIDHVVIGITRSDSGVFANCLQRDNLHANETRFRLKNPPKNFLHLLDLVGCEIWGNSEDVLIGNSHIATREGYSWLVLDDWSKVEAVIQDWKAKRIAGA